jgi:cytochrome c oxidase subunit 2
MNSLNLSSTQIRNIAIVGVLLIVGGFIIGLLTPSLFPAQASAEAPLVDNLFQIMLIIGGAIFLLVQGLLIYSAVKFRAKPGDTSDGVHIHGNATLEVIWTAIPAVIVTILTILSWNVFNVMQAPKDDEMVVHTTAARFNWAFAYDAPVSLMESQGVDVNAMLADGVLPESLAADLADGTLTVSTTELHTYAGRPVRMDMQSRDVIHAFWVPVFRIKQDVIPGRTTTVRFTPTLPNDPANAESWYPVVCTELCGAQHGAMMAYTIVHPDEASFNAWMSERMMAVLFPPPDPVERGFQILSSNIYPCYTCHIDANLAEFNWNGNVGPNLTDVGDRAVGARANATGLSGVDYLYQSIHEPGTYLTPGYGNLMPNLGIADCDIRAMVAYLCTQTASGEAACTIDTEAYTNECTVAAPMGLGPAGEATAEPGAEATAEPTPATSTALR